MIIAADTSQIVDFRDISITVCNIVGFLCDDVTDDGIWKYSRGDTWCETRCQKELAYQNPVLPTDTFMLQTQFRDFGTNTFNAELYNASNGELVFANVDDFTTRWFDGEFDGTRFQVMEIDVSAITVDCFYIRAFESTGRQVLFSEDFKIIRDNCTDTLRIGGTFGDATTDCFGYIYALPETFNGTGAFRYRNDWRIFGYLIDGDDQITKTVTGNKRTTLTVENTYQIEMTRIVPPYVKNILARQILAGHPIFVDGERYNVDTFSTNANGRVGRMWHFGIDLSRTCERNLRCALDSRPTAPPLDIGGNTNTCCEPCFG